MGPLLGELEDIACAFRCSVSAMHQSDVSLPCFWFLEMEWRSERQCAAVYRVVAEFSAAFHEFFFVAAGRDAFECFFRVFFFLGSKEYFGACCI